MDEQTLRDFCSYGNSMRQRQEAAAHAAHEAALPAPDLLVQEPGHFVMSKFGVGAKSAGWANGDTIRVVTKVNQ